MAYKGLNESIIELADIMEGMNYSRSVIDAVLGMLAPLTPQNKAMAVNDFIEIAKKGLPESEYHRAVSQLFEVLSKMPTPKKATKAMVQRAIAPYVQRDGLTFYLNKCQVEDITYELMLKFSNIYCFTSTDENGGQIFSVSSKTRHIKFVEILVK